MNPPESRRTAAPDAWFDYAAGVSIVRKTYHLHEDGESAMNRTNRTCGPQRLLSRNGATKVPNVPWGLKGSQTAHTAQVMHHRSAGTQSVRPKPTQSPIQSATQSGRWRHQVGI